MLSTWSTGEFFVSFHTKSRLGTGGMLTSQLGNILAGLWELVQCVACPERDERVQLRIVGREVGVCDSRDVVGIDGFGPRLELLDGFDGIVFRDGGRGFRGCG
jgi:hypothetical protein